MFQEIVAENGTNFMIAAVVVLLGLLCLALVMWILKSRPSSPFIRGGRNRTPRLAVLDAAAIDTRRRLVLVRRDDVEHLVMIGGPTDIVIESRIVGASAANAQAAVDSREPAPALVAPVAEERQQQAVSTTPVTATAVRHVAERRPAAIPEDVSSMGKVLYGAKDDVNTREIPTRPVTQQVAATRSVETTPQARAGERQASDMLDQARQRVLATPAQTTGGQATGGQVAVSQATGTAQATASATGTRPATAINPQASATDNPALVSEFEKMLEAEMASAANANMRVLPTPRTAALPATAQASAQAVALGGQQQATPKSREEAEAEMARLLGEISANRKP